MQAQVTPLDGAKAIGITFTDKPVTAFGGLALFVAFAHRIGLTTKLAEALPFVLTSPNATPPHHIVLAEARCIAHVWLRSGNTASARGATAFLPEVLALLSGRVQVARVRADSG